MSKSFGPMKKGSGAGPGARMLYAMNARVAFFGSPGTGSVIGW